MTTPALIEDWWSLWAKWPKGKARITFHPVLCHLIDVAVVTRLLWHEVLSPAARRSIAESLGLPEAQAATWIAFWAGLHDIGKVAPTFQLQVKAAHPQLRAAGFPCTNPGKNEPYHGTISARVLPELLVQQFQLPQSVATTLAISVGGHHGSFPTAREVQIAPVDNVGGGRWAAARIAIASVLAAVLGIPGDSRPRDITNPIAMALAGLISVADWIGSNERFFPHAIADRANIVSPDPAAYAARAEVQARKALAQLGWLGWQPLDEVRSFHDLFPHLRDKPPYPAQQRAITLGDRVSSQPGIVIIEAPMGEGKTEAAMLLADRWGTALGTRGHYFALPTQATSNQMFDRVREFLAARYPESVVNLQLLHGHAALSSAFGELQEAARRLFTPQEIAAPPAKDGAPPDVVAAEWFTYRKRPLLAPFGVGTIDQALLAILPTLHVFVRLFGLTAKAVIIDEVHAYDTYMSTLLERLLAWLGALGSPVVVLSATLPRTRCRRLLQAYSDGAGWSQDLPPITAYPRVTHATATENESHPLSSQVATDKPIGISWLDGRPPIAPGAPFLLGQQLERVLADGGCAVVICNTVRRAQEIFRALTTHFTGTADDGDPELDLLHARFLFEDRELREYRTRRRFGKPGGMVTGPGGQQEAVRRPHRAVLVATQIVEQSLDLDFDLLVTDIAPVDLVLQRAGRLQRHERAGQRPRRFADKRPLWICQPDQVSDGVPVFDSGSQQIYAPHILLRSWLALRDRQVICLPGDVEDLIEQVYDDSRTCPPLGQAIEQRWRQTYDQLTADIAEERTQAERRYLKPPSFSGALAQVVGTLREEDAPELHPAHQAMTRLIEISVPVVCLVVDTPFDLGQPPTLEQAKALLRRSVAITDRRVAFDLLKQAAPPGWTESPLLRNHRAIKLDAGDSATVGRYHLHLDVALGLEIVPRQPEQEQEL